MSAERRADEFADKPMPGESLESWFSAVARGDTCFGFHKTGDMAEAARRWFTAEVERLTLALQDMADEVLQLEHYCPCGARPETLRTHPHVGGCHVSEALRIWRDALAPPSFVKGDTP